MPTFHTYSVACAGHNPALKYPPLLRCSGKLIPESAINCDCTVFLYPFHEHTTLLLTLTFFGSCARRDETLEALSDAQFVAPAAQTVDLHSADHRNSFLYVFDYQTKFGDYAQVCFRAFFLCCVCVWESYVYF